MGPVRNGGHSAESWKGEQKEGAVPAEAALSVGQWMRGLGPGGGRHLGPL